jgi:hypothetical protein
MSSATNMSDTMVDVGGGRAAERRGDGVCGEHRTHAALNINLAELYHRVI